MPNAVINNLVDTWNNSSTAYDAIKMNVSDLASNVASRLIALQLGGVDKFTVTKGGAVTAAGALVADGFSVSVTGATVAGTLSVGGAATITGNLTARSGELLTSVRTSSGYRGGVSFDGYNTPGMVQSNLGGGYISTGDFSIWVRCMVPASLSNTCNIASSTSSSSYGTDSAGVANSAGFMVRGSIGDVCFFMGDSANQTFYACGLQSSVGQVVDLVATRTGSTISVYVNGTKITPTVSSGGTGCPASAAIDSSYFNVGGRYNVSAAIPYLGVVYRTAAFNRCLSDTDVLNLTIVGVDQSDQWGSSSSEYSSIFDGSSGISNDGWYTTRATVAMASTVGAVSNVMKVTVDSSASTTHYVYRPAKDRVPNRRYRVTLDAYIPSGNSLVNGLRVYNNDGSGWTTFNALSITPGTWATGLSFEVTPVAGRLDFVATSSGNTSFTGNSTDYFAINNVSFRRIGAFIDLDLTTGYGTIATDRSTNGLSGVLGVGTSWSSPSGDWGISDVLSSGRTTSGMVGGLNFSGASGTRLTSTLGYTIGNSDYSMWARFRVPSTIASLATNPGIIGIGPTATSASGNGTVRLICLSTGELSVRFVDGSGVTTYANVQAFFARYAGQVVDVVVARKRYIQTGDASALTIYINGKPVSYTGSPNHAGVSVTSTYMHVGVGGASDAVWPRPIYRAALFNRYLSQSDCEYMSMYGMHPADEWSPISPDIISSTVLNGGFETAGAGGADVFASWNESTSGTSTITRDTSVFYSGVAACRFDIDGSGSSATLTSGTQATPGKRYRISVKARGTGAAPALGINTGNQFYQRIGPAVYNSAAWETYISEFIWGDPATGLLTGASNFFAVSRYAGSASTSIWFDEFTVTRIGATVDLDFTQGAFAQVGGSAATVYDKSTNALHATAYGGTSNFQWLFPLENTPTQVPAGTATQAGVSVVSNSGTGMYWPGGKIVAITADGIEAVRWDSSIGTYPVMMVGATTCLGAGCNCHFSRSGYLNVFMVSQNGSALATNNSSQFVMSNGTGVGFTSTSRDWRVQNLCTSATAADLVIDYWNGSAVITGLRIDSNANVFGSAGSQAMSNGFFYIPSAGGAPSGVPTAISGRVPMYYDTTNNKLYIYNGAWKQVTLA